MKIRYKTSLTLLIVWQIIVVLEYNELNQSNMSIYSRWCQSWFPRNERKQSIIGYFFNFFFTSFHFIFDSSELNYNVQQCHDFSLSKIIHRVRGTDESSQKDENENCNDSTEMNGRRQQRTKKKTHTVVHIWWI